MCTGRKILCSNMYLRYSKLQLYQNPLQSLLWRRQYCTTVTVSISSQSECLLSPPFPYWWYIWHLSSSAYKEERAWDNTKACWQVYWQTSLSQQCLWAFQLLISLVWQQVEFKSRSWTQTQLTSSGLRLKLKTHNLRVLLIWIRFPDIRAPRIPLQPERPPNQSHTLPFQK